MCLSLYHNKFKFSTFKIAWAVIICAGQHVLAVVTIVNSGDFKNSSSEVFPIIILAEAH